MVDDTRHEGGSTMTFERQNEGLFNPDAYEKTEDMEKTKHGEQGGVAHLVHGWIQQNQINGVTFHHHPLIIYLSK